MFQLSHKALFMMETDWQYNTENNNYKNFSPRSVWSANCLNENRFRVICARKGITLESHLEKNYCFFFIAERNLHNRILTSTITCKCECVSRMIRHNFIKLNSIIAVGEMFELLCKLLVGKNWLSIIMISLPKTNQNFKETVTVLQ